MVAGGNSSGGTRQEASRLAPLAVRRAAWTRAWDALLAPLPQRGDWDDHRMPRIIHDPAMEGESA